ncbi:MAG: hypothetical protein ACRESZ_16005 [Methylococcales bacterium]
MVLQMYVVSCRQRLMMKHAAANNFLRSLTMAAGIVASTGALGQAVCPGPACQVTDKVSAEVQSQANTEFLGRYIGTAENTTQHGSGKMSIDIKQDDRNGYKLTTEASDGLIGNGTFNKVKISTDGQLSASGIVSEPPLVFRGSRAWNSDITGSIKGNRLTGNFYLFPLSGRSQACVPVPRYPCEPELESEGTFDLKKYRPLVR